MKKAIALLAMTALVGCTDAPGATRAVEAYGMTDVRITGHRWTGCSKDDNQRTGFIAKDRSGHDVSGVVCSEFGIFGKSNTVRID